VKREFEMTKQDLATELKKMYVDAPKGDSTTMIRLFGINYHAEISKGIRLAKYVKMKQ